MKIFLSILGGLVALAIIGFLVIAFSLGGIVKKAVNTAGPKITQTEVVLADATISPFSGKGTLTGLTVGNPIGWTTPRAFYLGEIAIEVDPGSLKGDHIIVNSIIIDSPEITYETKITSSNLQDLLKNIQKSSGSTSTTPPAEKPSSETKQPEPSTPAPAEKPVKIEVKTFRLKTAKLTLAGLGKSATVEMPLIALDNLGTREGGLTPEQLAAAVLKEISAQAIQAGANSGTGKELINKASEKAGEGLRKLLGGEGK